MNKPNICVTSADGYTGHHFIEFLLHNSEFKNNVNNIYGLAFDPKECKDCEQAGAKICQVDMGKLDECFKNCDSLFLIPPARTGKLDFCYKFIDAAKKAGVNNVLFLSTAGADLANKNQQPHLAEFIDIENNLKQAQFPNWCILRANFYAQNLLLYKKQLQEGKLPLPTHDGKFSPVHLNDVSKAACKILCCGMHMPEQYRSQMITLTGAETFDGKTLAEQASKVLGREIKFEDITEDEARRLLQQHGGIDKYEMDLLIEYYQLVKPGKAEFCTAQEFKKMTNQEPTPIKSIFEENKQVLLGH